MSASNQFDWVDFYKELSGKLLQYKNNRTELVEKVRRIYEITGINLPTLEKDNQIVDIDPFTFFGLFNKKQTDANRLSILKAIASIFDVKASVPTAFDSIPVLKPQNATFYYFIPDRGEDDIQDLWELFDAALAYSKNPSSETIARVSKYFDLCINRKGNGNSKITKGLYWIAPNDLLNLDRRNTLYIYESKKIPAEIVNTLPAIEAKIPSEKYFEIVEKLRAYFQSDASNIKDFKELSFEAWKYSEQVNQEKAAGQKAKVQRDNQGAVMIDREQCRTKKKKRKKYTKLLANFLKFAASIGTVVAAIMAWRTLDEMQIERNNAYRPEIVDVPNSFKGELLKKDELETGRKYLYLDYNAESPDGFYSEDILFTQEPIYKETCICLEWPCLTLKNIGQGTAKNIEVTFSSDWFVRAADQLSYYPEVSEDFRIPRDYKFTAKIESNDEEERVNLYYIDKDENAHKLTRNSDPNETAGRISDALRGEVLPKEYITYIASGDDSVDIMLPEIYCRMLGAFYYLPMERFKTGKLAGLTYSIDLPDLVITIKYSDLQGKTYGPEKITIPWTGSFKYVRDFNNLEGEPTTMEIITDFYDHYSR